LNWTDVVTAIAGLAVAFSSLVVSVVALRLTREQARAYLVPVPAVFIIGGTSPERSINMKNFGIGAMLGIWVEMTLQAPSSETQVLKRYFPALASNEEVVLLDPAKMGRRALLLVTVQVSYKNIRGMNQTQSFELSTVDLGGLEEC
jgi:hypothetical protein